MSQHNSHLDAFFQKAHSESPVFSDQEIEALLDSADLHGRQSDTDQQPSRTDMLTSTHIRKKRTVIMSSIAALLLGGLVSVGALYINSDVSEQPLGQHNGTTLTTGTESLASTVPAQSGIAVAPSSAADLTAIPASTELNGRDQDRKKVQIPDHEDDGKDAEITVEEELSKELQQFVETYWLEKINGYKNRIDRMLDPVSRGELDRLRVRYALLDDSDSPFNFGMQSSAMTSSDGRKVMIGAHLQSNMGDQSDLDMPDNVDGDAKEFNMTEFDFNVNAEDESGQNKVLFAQKNRVMIANDDDLDMEELTALLKEQGIDIDAENGEVHVVQSADGNGKISISVETDEDIVDEVNTTSERKSVVQRQIRINHRQDSEDNKSQIIIRSTQDGELGETSNQPHIMLMHKEDGEYNDRMNWQMADMDMKPIVGMLKMAIRSSENESSQIIVATWDLAEQHRAELDDLKAVIFKDITAFKGQLHKRLADFAAAHRGDMPDGLEQMLADGLEGEDSPFSEGNDLVKTLEPLYEAIAEPMILLYNGSDINGMLSSTIAEPVAGISLEANTTLKQSYPNPATSETTIEYTLPTQSNATVLRLFDSKGSEIRRIDLGAQNAGNHSTVLNVADLPAGTYLYHLTTGTARGEQVYSKTMQIAR